MSPLPESTKNLPRVNVLLGFLGAGKTTLLMHLLCQKHDERWAAVVNDVASVQVDGPVLKRVVGDLPVVELENGCVCCSSAEDLGEALAELAANAPLDHIWVETSGVALPQGIITLFTRQNPFGRSLASFASLANVVTVVDVAQLLAEWNTYRHGAVQRNLVPASVRPIIEMLIEQIEGADLIVLNKCDLLTEAQVETVEGIVRGLNARAEVLATEKGQVPVELLAKRARFDPVATPRSATWVRLLNEASSPRALSVTRSGGATHVDRFGINTATFLARKPFGRKALEAWLKRGAPHLLRAKGFCWIAEQPDEMIYLSIAASGVQIEPVAYWWSSRVENGKASPAEVPPAVRALWIEPTGDRRQELVFIGVDLDEPALHQELTACLV